MRTINNEDMSTPQDIGRSLRLPQNAEEPEKGETLIALPDPIGKHGKTVMCP